jgi:uridine kinase
MEQRHDLLQIIAEMMTPLLRGSGLRVGIDGVDGAGKTVMADELASIVRVRGRKVIRASVDGFHNPKEIRYRRGRGSAKGFFVIRMITPH